MILVAFISSKTKNISFYVTSFLKILDDKIIELDEYWGDNGVPPKWRIDMNIGSKIS